MNAPAAAFCAWCGAPTATCPSEGCRRPLDPPHFCPTCGRRMRVQVTPTGWQASCRDHGAPLQEPDANSLYPR